MTTFSDLMSLLMCFFVLLLSFAELDLLKYKQVAGALKFAFGVQRTVKATEIPKGTSVIAQQYSPGKPTETTVLETMREKTTDTTKTNLDFSDTETRNNQSMANARAQQEARKEAAELHRALAAAIDDGLIEVETFSDRVLIRIRERGSFGSGEADLKSTFLPILKLVSGVLSQRKGDIIISGHTDDIPIETDQFRSNWDLSAARSASVVHYIIQQGGIDPARIQIWALSDNEPIVPNNSWENRAKNRRVEINIRHGNQQTLDLGDVEKSMHLSTELKEAEGRHAQ